MKVAPLLDVQRVHVLTKHHPRVATGLMCCHLMLLQMSVALLALERYIYIYIYIYLFIYIYIFIFISGVLTNYL
jgi:hypothetical protein